MRHTAVRSAGRAPGLTALAHCDPRRLPLRQASVDGKTDRQRVVQVHVTPETERLFRERLNAGGERARPAGQRGVELVAVARGLARGVQRHEVHPQAGVEDLARGFRIDIGIEFGVRGDMPGTSTAAAIMTTRRVLRRASASRRRASARFVSGPSAMSVNRSAWVRARATSVSAVDGEAGGLATGGQSGASPRPSPP